MATRITATELARNLSDILNRIAYRGDEFEIERSGQTIAAIGPVRTATGTTGREIVARVGELSVPKGLGADLEDIHSRQGPVPPSPWDE
jgi:antitoxin (DNA-binding transcriptional repressor) of toxin-antitoxin stability system